MRQDVFNLLDLVNRQGLDNSRFGFIQDVDVESYFGVHKDIALEGHWLYLYLNENDSDWEVFECNNQIPECEHEFLVDVSRGEFLLLYKI